MNIIYISRRLKEENNGAQQVMSRNLEALKRIGGINITEYYLPQGSLKNVAVSLLQLGSYGITRQEEKKIVKLAARVHPDWFFIESSSYGSLVENLHHIGIPSICFAHNLDTEICSRSPLIAWLKYRFTRFNEAKSVRYANKLICLNNRDSNGFRKMFGRKADAILPITFPKRPLCINVDFQKEEKFYYLFVGSDFFPNVEGIKWFIEHVAPKVDACFRIVGSCCRNTSLATMILPKNVVLVGYSDNLDKEYQNAAGVIAPIFKGSGMKTKTIEALSYGKSIFGTSEAFTGIECDFSRVGALCNTADEFVEALSSTELKKTVNNYSLEIFIRNFSNEVFVERLRDFLKSL